VTQLDHVLGLDLGQAQDFSALALLERRWVQHEESRRWEIHFALRYLHRWPLKTSYPRIVADVCDLVQRPPLRNPLLAVDQTGVGRAVLDILRQARPQARVRPILITAGHEVTQDEEGSWHVPKKELASSLQAVLQQRRLRIANVPEREILVQELMNFRVKVTVHANEQFEAWRENQNDDTVLAVAMACWLGQHCQPGRIVAGGQQYASSAPGVQAEKKYHPYGPLGGHR
jgi:hypothetical protein